MTDRTCPLGEDCDLTVAWMAGREDVRKHTRRRLAEAADRIKALEAALLAADELAEVIDKPDQSDGRTGRYHYDWPRIDEALDTYRARRATGGGT